MPNITTTKISVSVLSTLYYDWSYQLEDCFLKRDAFLEHLIRTELPHVRADLAGKANSPRAKEYITRSLRMLGGEKSLPMKVRSFKVSKTTADELREVEKEHNLLRDALFNRWIVLMRSRPGLLNALDLPHSVPWNSENYSPPPLGPLPGLLEWVSDPFAAMRDECLRIHGCGLYELWMPEKLLGLSAYIEDALVPGTDQYDETWSMSDERLSALDQAEAFTNGLERSKAEHKG